MNYSNYVLPGVTVTGQDIRNLKAAQLGGVSAEVSFKAILDAFAALDGNEVLCIKDQEDMLHGVVIQTRAQKVIFHRWGENMVLDWTHNTNSLGFYMGKRNYAVVFYVIVAHVLTNACQGAWLLLFRLVEGSRCATSCRCISRRRCCV